MRNLVFALLAMAVLPGSAWADRATDARTLFQEANAHFAVGEFSEAAEKYQEAYKLKQDAALLYNAAQSYRLAGNAPKALVLYRNYLQFYPKAPNLDEVRSQITKLQQAITANEQAKSAPPTSTAEHMQAMPPPETKPAVPPPAAAMPAATSATSETAAPPPARPLVKKPWFWVVVVGGVAVVATGIALGVTLGSSTKDPTPSYGAVNGN